MNLKQRFNGAILAGGKSSRMGSDKALLTLENQTLLEKAKNSLLAAGAQSVVICRDSNEPDCKADIHPDCGPLGGIYTAIFYKPDLPLVIIPVDLPNLGPAEISDLVLTGVQQKSICHYSGQYIPIFLWDPKAIIKDLEESLKSRLDLSLYRFFSSRRKIEIPITQADILFNANTPEDWQSITSRQPN